MMNRLQDGQFAEAINEPEFRAALDASFTTSPEHYDQHRQLAETVLLYAIEKHPNGSMEWEARRGALLVDLYSSDDSLGEFSNYFRDLPITGVKPGDAYIDPKEMGESGPVQTNSKIITIKSQTSDPQLFVKAASEVIARQRTIGPRMVGPENYASSIKFFADLYQEEPARTNISADTIDVAQKLYVDFFSAARKEPANIIEVTNILSSISYLPEHIFPKHQLDNLAIEVAEQLPEFNKQIIGVLFKAISKIKGGVDNESIKEVVDLALHMQGDLEQSTQLVNSLKAIGNLNPSTSTDRIFLNLMKMRSKLELATFDYVTYENLMMELEGVVNHSLISRPALQTAVNFGGEFVKTAIARHERNKKLDLKDSAQLAADEEVVKRIATAFIRIQGQAT